MLVDTMLADINTAADNENATVIGEAFRLASITCDHCKYPENAKSFHEWLINYVNLKMKGRRLHRAFLRTDWCGGRHVRPWMWEDEDDYLRVHHSLLRGRIKHARAMLEMMWPCQECLERYNPTGKKVSDIYPPRKRPEGKGFIEL